jgi:hypothetical protein
VFADCSIPQEKSNAEINAELDLSDVSADEADGDRSNSKGFEPLPFFSAIHFFIITIQKIELVFCLITSDFIIHFCIVSLSSLQSTIMDTCKAESISASKPQDTIH